MFNASQSWPTTSPNFFFQQKRLSLKPLSLSFSSFLTRSLHLWLKPMTSMVGALKLNTSHQHHCHDWNSMVQPIATATRHARVALFSLSFSLSLSLFLFLFFSVVLWFMAKSFSFYCLHVCGFGDLVSFWGLMIWKKKGFWFGFGGCKKERIFVSSFGCSKGWIFGLGVAMFLRWDFGASGFLWLDVCVLCFM